MPNYEYKILNAASNMDTVIRETLVRDDFDDNKKVVGVVCVLAESSLFVASASLS